MKSRNVFTKLNSLTSMTSLSYFATFIPLRTLLFFSRSFLANVRRIPITHFLTNCKFEQTLHLLFINSAFFLWEPRIEREKKGERDRGVHGCTCVPASSMKYWCPENTIFNRDIIDILYLFHYNIMIMYLYIL